MFQDVDIQLTLTCIRGDGNVAKSFLDSIYSPHLFTTSADPKMHFRMIKQQAAFIRIRPNKVIFFQYKMHAT